MNQWTIFLCFLTSMLSIFAENAEILTRRLDPKQVHEIRLHHRDSGVTTIIFPAPIEGVFGSRVSSRFNKKNPTPFILSFIPGNYYLTVKSLAKEGTRGALNVICENQIYVLKLISSENGTSSIRFVEPAKGLTTPPTRPKVVPTLLLAMMDKAKAFDLFKKYYPEQVEHIEYAKPNRSIDYLRMEVVLKEVFRFNEEDTLIFHASIRNKTDEVLKYKPSDLVINLGSENIHAALTDASGIVQAKKEETFFIAVTGSKNARRNNLSPDNDWKVLLPLLNETKSMRVPELPKGLKNEGESK